MFKKLLGLSLVVLFGFATGICLAKYSGGDGSEANPYRISNAQYMNDIGLHQEDWGSHFVMVNDINLAQFTGTQFNIIGFLDANFIEPNHQPFTGIFDGNGHVIFDFTYHTDEDFGVGLFGFVEGPNAVIKNLRMERCDVNSMDSYNVGCLLGANAEGAVLNCSVKGTVSGEQSIGLLTGVNVGIISNCHVTGIVDGNNSAGGLVGTNAGTILDCYTAGIVRGNNDGTGGLVGLNAFGDGIVSNCYSTTNIYGDKDIGGLVGMHNTFTFLGRSIISNCYASGHVYGNDYVGGLIGSGDSGSYEACFWDLDINPGLNGIGNLTDPNVIGETTENMQKENTFTSAGWDFVGETANGSNDIWWIHKGKDYPRLWWETIGPMVLLDFLAQDIIDLELQPGLENSLLAKLDTALQKLEDDNENNDAAVINLLEAFINAVEAQRGKKIPEADADALIEAAQEIINLLSG